MERETDIRHGDVTLRVTSDGPTGAPPVLLLHGITSNSSTWDWFVDELAERHRVLRLDFRGHGRSARAPGEYHFPGYLADAAAACQQVAGGPCIVIGHSLGGGTAAALAQHQPALVAAIVLEDPPLAPAASLEGRALLDAFRLMRESIPRLQTDGVDVETLAGILAGAPSATGATFGDLLHPDALRTMADGMLTVDASVLDPVLDGTATPLVDLDRPFPRPTLLLPADPAAPDAVARPAEVERVRKLGREVEVRVMTGAGHLIHDEQGHRDTFREAVTDFLERI